MLLPSIGEMYKGVCFEKISLLKTIVFSVKFKPFFIVEWTCGKLVNGSEYLNTADVPCIDVIWNGKSFMWRIFIDRSLKEDKIFKTASSPVPQNVKILF